MDDWSTDEELFAIVERDLFSCVVGDIMDQLKLYHQFLPPQIRPLHNVVAPLARTGFSGF
jgi:hypothetical protein